MDSNTSSDRQPTGAPDRLPAGVGALAAAVEGLVAQDLDGLADTALAEQVLVLGGLVDCLEGQWLKRLAAVDGRGAAGAEQGTQEGSTAGWLRRRLRMGAGAASSVVRTARACFRGPLTQTGQALAAGELSPAHAQVLAAGIHDLADHLAAAAEPVLVEAARRLDPPRLRQVIGHLRQAADPDGAAAQAERRHGRRGLWLASTFEGMVALQGLLDPEAGQTLLAALEPLARPANAADERSGDQRRADALVELARRNLEGGQLPLTGGVRPQLTVTVDLDTLHDHPGGLGGQIGGVEPLDPEACRRLACDSTLTRVLITRHPTHHPGDQEPIATGGHHGPADLEGWLGAAAATLPPILGGAPTQPLEVGRTSRVVTAAQRSALAVRDRGCGFPGCGRPPSWCEAHHLVHWLHGGPTDLANLILLCRTHHRAVHEGGWRLTRQPDGQLTATPPHRPHRPHRRPHTAA